MKLSNLFYSFRGRLLLVMAGLLLATLGVQYILNQRAARRVAVTIAEQEQALAASIALALESINSNEYMAEIDGRREASLLETRAGRVINVLVVRDDGTIEDSLDPAFTPRTLEDGSAKYHRISEVRLPKLVASGHPEEDLQKFLQGPAATGGLPVAGEPRAFTIPVRTNKALNHIIVVLGAPGEAASAGSPLQGARPLLPTLAVLLVATLVATLLVLRFTRPITGLSQAARRVAGGDFSFRVRGAERRDEMGALAANFNEMIRGLEHARELETRLNQSERSATVGRLASAIAHEIRNPLNYINLTLDHLRTSLAPNDPQKRATVERLTLQLKAEVARINTRISEFLKYTRPATLDRKPLDLRAEIEDAMRIIEVQAAEGGVETRVEQRGEVPPVLSDKESLRSVFTNLIINGLQAIEGDGGKLMITISSDDGLARVEVTDTGRGIAEESLPQIFEPYFSTKETGTGLGLAIVKKAIEEHGGHVRVSSKQNEGTTFTVELPTGGSDE